MRLTIFGASGATGTLLVRQALDAGHEVTAVVRDPSRLAVEPREGFSVVTAEITDTAGTADAVKGADAVITAIGPRQRGPTSVAADSTRAILAAMEGAGVYRFLLTSSSALVPDAGDDPFTRYVVKPVILGALLKDRLADMRGAEQEVHASTADWTIVRLPRLSDGAAKGRYRTGVDLNVKGGFQITRSDLATCMLALLDDDTSIHKHIAVAN